MAHQDYLIEWINIRKEFSKPYDFKDIDNLYKSVYRFCHISMILLDPVQIKFKIQIDSKSKFKFLSINYRYMKEILPKIKILYYKNIMYTDYSFSNKLLKIWKHLEICITCMKYDKSRIFPFLGKKIGEDMSIMIYQYLNPDPK